MADSKISALTSGGLVQAGDALVVARAGASLRVAPAGMPVLVYRYTVTGSDKASIDTGVDTADAGSNDWTNGDLLEIWFKTTLALSASNPLRARGEQDRTQPTTTKSMSTAGPIAPHLR